MLHLPSWPRGKKGSRKVPGSVDSPDRSLMPCSEIQMLFSRPVIHMCGEFPLMGPGFDTEILRQLHDMWPKWLPYEEYPGDSCSLRAVAWRQRLPIPRAVVWECGCCRTCVKSGGGVFVPPFQYGPALQIASYDSDVVWLLKLSHKRYAASSWFSLGARALVALNLHRRSLATLKLPSGRPYGETT